MFLFGPIGPQELLIVLLIIVVLFGAKKLPDLGKSIGEGIKNFKSSIGGKEKPKDEDPPENKPQPPAKD